jgi:hypothetical protein
MNPKTKNHQRPASSITVPGSQLTVKVMEFLFKPLLKAQWRAGCEESKAASEAAGRAAAEAQIEAWKARQRAAGIEFVDDAPQEQHPPSLRR